MKLKSVDELPPAMRAQAAAAIAKQTTTRVASPVPRESKFGNEKTNGYDSAHEAKRAVELQLMEAGGAIRDLRMQVPFELIPAHYVNERCIERSCRYVADFVYIEVDTGARVVEDAKGYRDAIYRIKRKLMLRVHGVRIRET